MMLANKWTMGVALLLFSAAHAHAAMMFTGDYDVSNWTPSGAGSLDTSGAPNSISMTSNNDASGFADLRFEIAATGGGIVSFDWNYQTFDSDSEAFWDPFGYVVNGVFTQLSNDAGAVVQSGTASFAVNPADVFGFSQRSFDSIFGSAQTTISNFDVAAVPEPASLTLVGLGAFGLAVGAMRRRKQLAR